MRLNIAKITCLVLAIIALGSFNSAKKVWIQGTIENPNLNELSGLAPSYVFQGKYWGHNDSMNSAHLFLLAENGKDHGQTYIESAPNFDWEAIQTAKCVFAPSCIYLGDIGDNLEFRSTIRIEIIPEPKNFSKSLKPKQALILKYPDGAHNAESLLISKDGRRLYIIEKLDWENRKRDVRIYGAEIPFSNAKIVNINLSLKATISNKAPKYPIGSITDAALLNNRLYFRDYRNIYFADAFKGLGEKLQPININAPKIKQSEALTISPDGAHLLVGSEGKNSKLIKIQIKKEK